MSDLDNFIIELKNLLNKYDKPSEDKVTKAASAEPIKLLTSERCYELFGDPRKESSMILWDVPMQLEIGAIPKRIYCNKAMVKPLENAFRRLIQTGCVAELKTWDGCFNIRPKKGANSYSLHSWGLAVDVNAAWNQLGKPPTLSKEFVECFTENGFNWGGYWRLPDGMHFELKPDLVG